MAAPDYSDRYNTELDPQEEMRFRMWMAGDPQRADDLTDYDLRGAWKAAGGKLPKQGHLPDTFKKPNHPTFSAESIYQGRDGMQGGTWTQKPGGRWSFTTGPANVEMYGEQGLRDYFSRVEPDSDLAIGEAMPGGSRSGQPMPDSSRIGQPMPTPPDAEETLEPLLPVGGAARFNTAKPRTAAERYGFGKRGTQ